MAVNTNPIRVPLMVKGNQVGSAILHSDGLVDIVMGYRMSSVIELYELAEDGRLESLHLNAALFNKTGPPTLDATTVEENSNESKSRSKSNNR